MIKINHVHKFLCALISLIMVPLLAGPGCYLLDDGSSGTALDDLNRLTVLSGAGSALVGEWLFSGNANDTSGNNNNGTTYNISSANDRIGLANKAYSFNGTNTYIDCGNGSSLNMTDEITLSAWIYVSSLPTAEGYIVAKWASGDSWILLLGSDGRISFVLFPFENLYSAGAITLNKWTFVTATYKASDGLMKLYINGAFSSQKSETRPITTSAATVQIGRHGGGIQYFKGLIDNVRVYSKALSVSEIQDVMKDGLMGEWLFSGNANDTSGNVNNGTVYSATLTANRFATASSAYSFGSGRYISASTWNNLPLGGHARTLSVWFMLSSLPTEQFSPIVSYGQWGRGDLYETGIWYESASGKRYMFFGNGDYVYGYSASLSTGVWYHLAVTSSGGSWTLYLNGAELRSDTCPINTIGGPVYFGGYQGYPTNYFPGAIDDLRIFNRRLSATEVSELVSGL